MTNFKLFITIVLTLVISPLNIKAQVNQEWVKTFNNSGNSSDISYGIAVDNSGNSYVTGSILNGLQTTDYATIKYNASGNQEWLRIYNGPANNLDYARDIAVDGDGYIYVTGLIDFASSCATIKYSPSGDSIWVRRYLYGIGYKIFCDASNNIYVAGRYGDASFSDYFVVKYNSFGTELWSKRYNAPGNGPDVANAIDIDNAGNVYLTGSVFTGGHYAMGTVKFNSSGTQMWEAIYDCPDFGSDAGNAIDADNSGNVYVAGYSDSTVTGRDFMTIKYNSSGAVQWTKRFNDGYDEAVDIKVFDDDNIYVTGPSLTATRPDDFTIIKYNSAGFQQWMVMYNGGGTDRPNKMLLDNQGNIYITGMSQVLSWEDVATVKYNSNGILLWNTTFTGQGNYPDTGLDMALDAAGNVFVTGRTYSGLTSEDYLTLKYSQTTNIRQISSASPGSYNLLQNYPNPFNPSTRIGFSIPASGLVSLKVYDILGKEISELVNENLSPGNYEVDFDGTNVSGGVYFMNFNAGDYRQVKRMLLVK